jgi:hypothetical protein
MIEKVHIMDEQDFRASLLDAVSKNTAPPAMRAEHALRAGRRAARRRTAATGGAAVGVAAVVATVAMAAGGVFGSHGPLQVGTPGLAPSAQPGTAKPNVWPTGPDGNPQQDRTARAGLKYEQGQTLGDQLLAVVPAGYTVPDNPGGDQRIPSRYAQAQFEDRVGGKDLWTYMATAQVAKDGKAGQLIVEVHDPGLGPANAAPCALAASFWGESGTCEVVAVDGIDVGVVTSNGADRRLDQWAAYRHPDGTVVYFAQSRQPNFAGDATPEPLDVLPLTKTQLAGLAKDQRFHVNS